MSKRYDVFVSHSSEDRPRVEKIVTYLEENGFHCFASYRLMGGVNWNEELSNALSDSAAFLLVLTKSSTDSTYVSNEVAIAINDKLPVFPFRVDKVEYGPRLRIHLASCQWIDAEGGRFQEGLAELVLALRGHGISSPPDLPADPKKLSPKKEQRKEAKPPRGWPALAPMYVLIALIALVLIGAPLLFGGVNHGPRTQGVAACYIVAEGGQPLNLVVKGLKPGSITVGEQNVNVDDATGDGPFTYSLRVSCFPVKVTVDTETRTIASGDSPATFGSAP